MTDQNRMKTAFEFAEILEFFNDETQAASTSSTPSHSKATSINAGWETVLDPAGLAYLIGQTAVYTTASYSTSTPYNRYKRTVIRPNHTFTAEQTTAFNDLRQWSELSTNFNYKELKSSYRLAMLKTHPDQGGSSENFWSVKKSYEVLCSLVKS